MICVDTSITSLCWFHDQIRAVKDLFQSKLNAHPDNLVGIATFGQRDLGICLDPTNSRETIFSKLLALKPLEQECTFELSRLGWFCPEHMKNRIVVFSGCPLLFTTDQLPEALKQRRVVLDVVDFGTRVKDDEEDCKAKYLKELVDAMNDNNNENEDSRYFLFQDDGFSLTHHISSSSIIPPLSEEAVRIRNLIRNLPIRRRRKAKINSDQSSDVFVQTLFPPYTASLN